MATHGASPARQTRADVRPKATPARCTVCDLEPATREPFFYVWLKRQFWIYRCPRCTHQFVYPSVTPEEQALIYGDRYFSGEGDWVCGVFPASYVQAEAQLREEAKHILDMLPVQTGRLLDIGCAGGVFLDEARTRGFEVVGIELNPQMAQHARRTYHVEVVNSRIEEVPHNVWDGAFDVITLLDCLEHLPQPLAAMRKVGVWLRPGGLLLIRGPLCNSPFARLKEALRRTLRVTKCLPGYPLDANMFNKRSLDALLRITGFELIEWIGETRLFSNLLAQRTC
jgi:2-polyprenyl-3-methyl-5-hydroxy-6-metoxy-1,4-benzoquinol methylase